MSALAYNSADELFAKKGPTITKKISCSNICTIQCGTTKLFLDDRAVLLIREKNNCCTAVNLLMAYQSCKWFPQIANQKPTICATWLHLLTFRLWGLLGITDVQTTVGRLIHYAGSGGSYSSSWNINCCWNFLLCCVQCPTMFNGHSREDYRQLELL